MSEKEKFYITTAIAYTSRKPHIGNTYEAIYTDVIARFNRMLGKDVFFLTGTDEHGQKIEEIAKESGVSCQAYVDGIAGEIRAIWDRMNVSYDKFIRTTDDYHVAAVQKIFKQLYDQGDIYKGEYEGWYCTPCESFFTDTQIEDGKCPDCGRPVQKTKEEAYFFKMSNYQDKLMDYIESHPDFIQPESRKREMVNNFLKPGLQDLCVSRTSFKWGIPVTFDDNHVIYVWIDALSNYITALGYGSDDDSLYQKYWPADVHVIGKDILRFHTIYWPIMLMALGQPLPKQIFGHPWLLFGEDKMSKSRGNVIYADDLADKFGTDAVRYYVLREMPFAQDGTITYENIIARYNADLANTLGNLVNRTVSMAQKYFGGAVSRTDAVDALEALMALARRCNKYIDETAPWALAKDEAQLPRLQTVLYNLLEAIRYLGILCAPFMPETSEKILAQIGEQTADFTSLSDFRTDVKFQTSQPEPLFARIDEKKLLAELAAAAPAPEAKKEEPKQESKPEITIDEFAKVELKVGVVKDCKPVEGADKLLVSQIKIGDETRQIVSGIAKYYTPDEMIGKKVVVVTNLKPVKLRGVLSEGMILCASAGKSLSLVSPDDAIPDGAEVR